jgi:hypothetical protein
MASYSFPKNHSHERRGSAVGRAEVSQIADCQDQELALLVIVVKYRRESRRQYQLLRRRSSLDAPKQGRETIHITGTNAARQPFDVNGLNVGRRSERRNKLRQRCQGLGKRCRIERHAADGALTYKFIIE